MAVHSEFWLYQHRCHQLSYYLCIVRIILPHLISFLADLSREWEKSIRVFRATVISIHYTYAHVHLFKSNQMSVHTSVSSFFLASPNTNTFNYVTREINKYKNTQMSKIKID